MYESPVNVIMGEMQMQVEGEIYKAIQNVGIDVNKEELLKALMYDRGQYDKGYADAIDEFAEKFIFKAVCEGCSGCCDCYENEAQNICEDWKYYMEIAEQLKGGL